MGGRPGEDVGTVQKPGRGPGRVGPRDPIHADIEGNIRVDGGRGDRGGDRRGEPLFGRGGKGTGERREDRTAAAVAEDQEERHVEVGDGVLDAREPREIEHVPCGANGEQITDPLIE